MSDEIMDGNEWYSRSVYELLKEYNEEDDRED